MDNFTLEMEPIERTFRLSIGSALPQVEWYEGPYEVIPRVIAQSLSTATKGMRRDVTVEAIPYYETSNPSGTTAIIGE